MATGTTKYSDLSVRNTVYAQKKMLETPQPMLILEALATHFTVPLNSTRVASWVRADALPLATTPVVEGVVPSATKFTTQKIEATLKQYIGLVSVTDVLADTHEDGNLMALMEQMGYQLGNTVEAIRFGEFVSGTNKMQTNGTNRSDINTELNRTVIRKAIRSLKLQKAKPISRMVAPSVNYATTPVSPAYVGVAHTSAEMDIRNMGGFSPVENYANEANMFPGEIGRVDAVRFVISTEVPFWANAGAALGGTGMLSTGGSNIDVYPLLIIGMDALGVVSLKGPNAATPYLFNPVPSAGNPTGQVGHAVWKLWTTALILNQAHVVRVEHAIKQDPA